MNKEEFELLTGESILRRKRDANDAKNQIKESLGIGDPCGAGIGNTVVKVEDQCNAISKCTCDDGLVKTCKCALSWWFVLIIVSLVLTIVGMIICCVLKALGKLFCCK